jgi:hypothetical protein
MSSKATRGAESRSSASFAWMTSLASGGQVYRARLHGGRQVAVKVQYPGVAQAVRADLQNLGLILRAAKRIAPGIDPKALAAEVRERLGRGNGVWNRSVNHGPAPGFSPVKEAL